MFTTGGFFALKPLIQLIFSGVFDRHPRLRLAITETGNLWVSNTLRNLDWLVDRARSMPTSQEARIPGPALLKLSLRPSEYWARNCWHGASFIGHRSRLAQTYSPSAGRSGQHSDGARFSGDSWCLVWPARGQPPSRLGSRAAGRLGRAPWMSWIPGGLRSWKVGICLRRGHPFATRRQKVTDPQTATNQRGPTGGEGRFGPFQPAAPSKANPTW
jgi:hypothetical protein